MTSWIIIAVVVIFVGYVIMAYNGLVTLRARAKEAWADIDVQLKRRYDLIPNLVETVKGYAAHERGTFDEVTQARNNATQIHVDPSNVTPDQIKAMAGAEQTLGGALGRLMAISENYPDLKANQNFLDLQQQLTDTEDKIQAARRFYNGNVRDLSIRLQSFPTNLIGNTFGFTEMQYFDLGDDQAAREAVAVKF